MSTSTIVNLLLIIGVAWFVYTRVASAKGLRNLGSEDFKKETESQAGKVLIDVREPSEFKSGHIPKAVNIPLSQLGRRSGELPKDGQVYLYCRSGMRSKQAARILSKQGFTKLAHLQGGIMAWNGTLRK